MTSAKTNIIELSRVLQGEGSYSGMLSLLVRISGCPLRCKFGENRCDTEYSSWGASRKEYSLDDLKKFIDDNSDVHQMIITGGEPLMRPELLGEILKIAGEKKMFITIETSGIYPYDANEHARKFLGGSIIFMSISPKLSNSVPTASDGLSAIDINRHDGLRKRYSMMRITIESANLGGYQLKFVIRSKEDIDEAMEVVEKVSASKMRVFMMPEGVAKEEIDIKRRWIMEECIARGVNYSDRLHVLAYGNKRGV